MKRHGYLLADIPDFGRIFDCGDCGNIHLTVGPVSLTLEPRAYMQLVALVNTSAANFETWTGRDGACSREAAALEPSRFEDTRHADRDDYADQA